ncbi:MAG: thiaminase II [Egibacteraceae bacterium]
MTNFSRHLWDAAQPVYDAILAHPFLGGLTNGTLERETFRGYVVQDAHYLRGYARALSLCAAKAPAEADIRMFAEHAAGAIAVERELHASFFADFGMAPHEVAAVPLTPTTTAYVTHLMAVCGLGSFAEALGAVLPCYWIYAEVGTHLLAAGTPDPLYQRWIDTYGGEEFAAVVQAVLDLTDRVGPGLSRDDRAAATAHYLTSSRYEWMFWDASWRQERWPV